MKKLLCLFVMITMLELYGCATEHMHNWNDADCVNPITCVECGETQGEPKGHAWTEASCKTPKTCKVCKTTEGTATEDHTWKAATCISPKTCTVCRKTEGTDLGHTWEEATCETSKICKICGLPSGSPLGHQVEKWKVSQKATCAEPGKQIGVCSVCGQNVEEPVTVEHTPGKIYCLDNPEGYITMEVLIGGTLCQNCTVCDEVLVYSTAADRELSYKLKCISANYQELARNLGQYKGQDVKINAKVYLIYDQDVSGNCVSYRLAAYMNGDDDQSVYVTYTTLTSKPRILDDDEIIIYGEITGDVRLGDKICIEAEYIDIQ